MIPPLEQALDNLNTNTIAALLAASGVVDVPKPKAERVNLWKQRVGDPARIASAWQALNAQEQRALQIVQAEGSELRTGRFLNLLQRAGLVGIRAQQIVQNSYYRQDRVKNTDLSFIRLLEKLLLSGLLSTHTQRTDQSGSNKLDLTGGAFVYIPEEVLPYLPPIDMNLTLPQVNAEIAGSARTFQRDLYLYWSAVREARLGLTTQGFIYATDIKRLTGQLVVTEQYAKGSKETDYRRLFFLRQMLTVLHLLHGQNGSVTHNPQTDFFTLPPAERVQKTYQTWVATDQWNELWATYVQGQTTATGTALATAPSQVVHARQTVIKLLTDRARSGPTEWISINQLADWLQNRNDQFLLEETTRYYYYSQSSDTTGRYEYNAFGWRWNVSNNEREEGWNRVERRFIEAVLCEGLYWLGLLDLGYDAPVTPSGGAAPNSPLAVRLTDMGRWLLLGMAQPEIPQENGRVVVQPNFHILAFDPVADAVLGRLETFAVRLNAERVMDYELNRESVYRAQLAGQSAQEISTWLEEVTGANLPQNVARSLLEWQETFEQVVIRSRASWIETATPELADALLANEKLSPAIIRRVTPTGMLVQSAKLDKVEQFLRAAGEMPVRSRAADNAHRKTITLSADGQIAFVQAAPNFFTLSQLQTVAEQTPTGWQLTSASIQKAMQNGRNIPAIIAALETLAINGVALTLQQQIKAWSGFYGSARVQTVTLVQFKDQDTLLELLTDPVLADWMQPWQPQTRLGLALVAPKNVAALVTHLAARGVDVQIVA